MNHVLDLKHVALILSAGIAVGARFLSDFSFATIQHQASVANLDMRHLSLGTFGPLLLNMLSYQLQRDWFNLSPQALPELTGLLVVLLGAYGWLRRTRAPESAAAMVLLATPLVPLAATIGACVWVLSRSA